MSKAKASAAAAEDKIMARPHFQNKLYYGDNLEVLRKYIKDESVDLCYIDPPFNSNRTYNQIYNNIGKEDKAQAQAFIDTWTWDTMAEEGFADIMSNERGSHTKQTINLIYGLEKIIGKGSLFAYIISMTLRITEIYRVLKDTGTFYLHCDPTASHYLKLLLDSIFCSRKGEYLSEFVWCYGERALSKRYFNKKHDTILFYSKTDKYTFNYKEVAQAYSDTTIKKFKHIDKKTGKKFRLRGRNVPEAGALRRQTDIPLSLESEFTYRQYLENSDGVLVYDWVEMDFLNQAAAERLGYDTQKPEALLELFILASSNKGDLVLDAYCGCGTTVAVCERLERQWIGVDITYQSISLILKRLEENFGISTIRNVELNGVPQDFEAAEMLAHKEDDRIRKEFEKWAVLTFSNNRAAINEKKGGDGGIDGYAFMIDFDENKNQVIKDIIFSVKSDKKLNPSVVRDLYGTMQRESAALGFLLTLYPMPNLVAESRKYGIYQNTMFGHSYPCIEVISVSEILDGKTMKVPTTLEVLKKAEQKAKDVQHKLF
jgi:DNA modification methylase